MRLQISLNEEEFKMAIIFSMNENGKVKLYPYGITDGTNTVPWVW